MKPGSPGNRTPSRTGRFRPGLLCVAVLWVALRLPAGGQVQCIGDCDGDGVVEISELIRCIGISLGDADLAICAPCDADRDGAVRVNELVAAVGMALTGCTRTPTATPTAVPSNSCPYAFDGECDEPGIGTGACPAGTDSADCRPPSTPTAVPSNSCPYAFDGECDEPGIGTGACPAGTDSADCR